MKREKYESMFSGNATGELPVIKEAKEPLTDEQKKRLQQDLTAIAKSKVHVDDSLGYGYLFFDSELGMYKVLETYEMPIKLGDSRYGYSKNLKKFYIAGDWLFPGIFD